MDDRVREALKIATNRGIPMLEVMRPELDRLTGQDAVHQGIALKVPPYEYAHPIELLDEVLARDETPLLVALDGITDPRNLGAIIRSAGAFGGQGVIVPQRRSVGVTASAWKTSAGAAARMPVAMAPNLTQTLKALKERGVFVLGLDGGGDVSLPGLTLGRPTDRARRRQRGQGPLAPRRRDLRRHRLDPDRADDRVAERRHRGIRHPLRDLEAARRERGVTAGGVRPSRRQSFSSSGSTTAIADVSGTTSIAVVRAGRRADHRRLVAAVPQHRVRRTR